MHHMDESRAHAMIIVPDMPVGGAAQRHHMAGNEMDVLIGCVGWKSGADRLRIRRFDSIPGRSGGKTFLRNGAHIYGRTVTVEAVQKFL